MVEGSNPSRPTNNNFMKPPEQMGGSPEQPEESPMESNEEIRKEHKVTTPEEAAEITRQRRREYGLEESSDLTPEKLQEIETEVEKLLEQLDEYDFDSFGPEVQEEWYWAELEAGAGKDRELAVVILKRFISTLKEKTG